MNTRQPVAILLCDGFLQVSGVCPGLEKKLRYFRKEIRTEGYRRNVVRHFEDLYAAKTGEPDTIVTMPGFAHRVIDHCRSSGIPFTFADARTPMPEPDYARAFVGLREYQVPLVGRMLKNGGGVLRGSTGMGKTVCAAALIRAYDHDELVSRGTPLCVFACPDKDINRKNHEEFRKLLPGRDVGIVMSGVSHDITDDVICCTIDSMDHLEPERIGILIVDEMHTASSDTRQERIQRCAKAARWGVSATPTGRFDGADLVAEGLFGPIVAEFTYQDGVRAGALVPITVYWIDCPKPDGGVMEYARLSSRDGKVRRGSTANSGFCQMVADIMNSIPDSVQTLCMLQFIEQMSRIHRLCRRTGYVHGETNQDNLAAYPTIDAISPKERKRIYDRFSSGELKSVISSHVWKQGVDFKELKCVVNAGGGGSDIVAKQVPGRASRAADGKEEAFIVDFTHSWDREDPVAMSGRPGPLLSNDRSRRKAYADLGFKQVTCNSILDLPFLDRSLAAATPTASRAAMAGFSL